MIFKRLKDHVYICTQFQYVFGKIKSFEDLDLCKKDLLQVRKFFSKWDLCQVKFGTFTYPYLGIIGLEVLGAYIAHVTF